MYLLGLGILLAIKLPLILCGAYLYRIIHDVPEPEFKADGGDFVKAEFGQGPRTRGPGGPAVAAQATPRRGNPGHDHEPTPARSDAAVGA